jgi:hypothetical protein
MEIGILPFFKVLHLPERSMLHFFKAAAMDKVVGGRIYDHHIGHIALTGGARGVVTSNLRHFAWLSRHGVEVIPPEALELR